MTVMKYMRSETRRVAAKHFGEICLIGGDGETFEVTERLSFCEPEEEVVAVGRSVNEILWEMNGLKGLNVRERESYAKPRYQTV